LFRSEEKLLEYEAKKNLELRTILENLDSFSEQDIQNSNLLKWMKLAIIKNKNLNHISKLIDSHIEIGFVEDVSGKILQWNGTDKFIYFGKSQILIKFGDCIFMTKQGIWFDTVFTKRPDASIIPFVKFIQESTFSEYKTFRQKQLQAKNPNFEQILPIINANDSMTDSKIPFKIYRM